MPFTVEKLPDAPIILVVHESKQAMQEMPQVIEAIQAAVAAEPEPVFVVMDIRELGLRLDDLPLAASNAALKPDALLHHPKIRENLMVTNDGLIKLAAQGLRTATFGNVRIRIFGTPEQAYAYCFEQLAVAREEGTGKSQAGH